MTWRVAPAHSWGRGAPGPGCGRWTMPPADSQATTSVWILTEGTAPEFPPLKKNLTADVCVVGAGIAGLTTAYLLAKEGKKVVVLEAAAVGGGETGRTTAHLSNALDD